METTPPALEIPSFLFGTYASIERSATREGQRCARQYQEDGTIPSPREMAEVKEGEIIITRGVVDLVRERAAWRLYMVASTTDALCGALDWKNAWHLYDLYEAMAGQMAWGALYYAISIIEPMGTERVAVRLERVLRFWEVLDRARYIVRSPSAVLTLDELMTDACGWAVAAWCPEVQGDRRTRIATAASRMARATREDSIEAVLRQLPKVLPLARELEHRDVLADPAVWRARLSALDVESFGRVSAALPANLIECLYSWDKELGRQ